MARKQTYESISLINWHSNAPNDDWQPRCWTVLIRERPSLFAISYSFLMMFARKFWSSQMIVYFRIYSKLNSIYLLSQIELLYEIQNPSNNFIENSNCGRIMGIHIICIQQFFECSRIASRIVTVHSFHNTMFGAFVLLEGAKLWLNKMFV